MARITQTLHLKSPTASPCHSVLALFLEVMLVLAGMRGASGGDFPRFEMVEIDARVGEICYAVTAADVDGDGRMDVVAVTESAVVWFRNPEWTRHVLIQDQTERDNVCIAGGDLDGDGAVDFALGAGWTERGGTIYWLCRNGAAHRPWRAFLVGSEPSLHRMRLADVRGTGRPQLVISPLVRSSGNGVRLTALEIPRDPARERWMPTLMNYDFNRMHNHWHADLDRDGQIDTLTASQEGVHWIRRVADDFEAQRISAGASGPNPEDCGAGEVKTGTLADGRPFIATIEPMHGNSVVAYSRGATEGSATIAWKRHVLDSTLARGHALWAADVDNDGADEIVVGHSDRGQPPTVGPGLYVYDCIDERGLFFGWTRHVIDDGGIAVEDAVAADFDGDGWIDLVAGGRATHNVRVYWNRGKE